MNINPLITLVEKVAPGIAAALGGPGVGVATTLLENLFGVNSEALPQTIAADPNAGEKLKELEYKHGEVLASIVATNYATEVDDRKNAREMGKLNNSNDWVMHLIAIVFTFGIFIYIAIWQLCFPSTDKGIFHDLLNVFMMICSYYFGSSYKVNK